jgi:hypothetical protein
MFIKTLNAIREKLPPKKYKMYPKKNSFSCPHQPPNNVFSLISPCSTIMPTIIFHDSTNDGVQK